VFGWGVYHFDLQMDELIGSPAQSSKVKAESKKAIRRLALLNACPMKCVAYFIGVSQKRAQRI
jgi:hypothetical protein